MRVQIQYRFRLALQVIQQREQYDVLVHIGEVASMESVSIIHFANGRNASERRCEVGERDDRNGSYLLVPSCHRSRDCRDRSRLMRGHPDGAAMGIGNNAQDVEAAVPIERRREIIESQERTPRPAPAPARASDTPKEKGNVEAPAALLATVKDDLARRLLVKPEIITVVSALEVTWPDGGLGCGRPGEMYTQATVPGYRIILAAADKQYPYHSDLRGRFVLVTAVDRCRPYASSYRSQHRHSEAARAYQRLVRIMRSAAFRTSCTAPALRPIHAFPVRQIATRSPFRLSTKHDPSEVTSRGVVLYPINVGQNSILPPGGATSSTSVLLRRSAAVGSSSQYNDHRRSESLRRAQVSRPVSRRNPAR